MLARYLHFPFVLAVAVSAFTAASANAEPARPPAPLTIGGLGAGAIPLGGLWQFHVGDNPEWASPAFDDSSWEQLSANQPWGEQGHASYTGFAWYRRHIEYQPAAGAEGEIALLIPHIDDAYELYWNGVLVGRNGQLKPYPVWYYSQAAQCFRLGHVQSGVLSVRVWKAPLMSDDSGGRGGFDAAPLVGNPDAIAANRAALDYQWLRNRQFVFSENLLYALVGLLSFLAWWRNRSQWIMFWMTGFALATPLNLLLLNAHRVWPYVVVIGLAQTVSSIQDISLWFLLLWLLNLHENRVLSRLTCVLAGFSLTINSLDGLLVAISWSPRWTELAQWADAATASINTLIEAFPLVLVGFAFARHRRLDLARWLVAILAFIDEMSVVLRDALKQGRRFTHWTIAAKFDAPLFTLGGNAISVSTLIGALLIVSIVYAAYNSLREDRRRQNSLEQELRNAQEIQQALIPEKHPPLPGFALTSAYRPAQEVGGDFFQLISQTGANGSTMLVVGDVSGKGLKAAMSVSLILGAVHALADFVSGPAQLLVELNRRLVGRLHGGFATCLVLRLEFDGTCMLASAGHPPPFLNQQELELPGALPLGLIAVGGYEQSLIHLQSGDRLVLYTDGLLEARSRSGEIFGFQRLQSLFATRPSADQAAEAAVNFGQEDDITVLTLTRLTTGEDPSVLRTVAVLT
ncbi:MAG: SpoIIE family protein phosphatase [Terracidiphilus sp.]